MTQTGTRSPGQLMRIKWNSSVDEAGAIEQLGRVRDQLPEVPFGTFTTRAGLSGIGDEAHYVIQIAFSGPTDRFASPEQWAQTKAMHGYSVSYAAYEIKDKSDDRIRVIIRQILAHWLEGVAILVIGEQYR